MSRLYGCEMHDEILFLDPEEAIQDVAKMVGDEQLPRTGTITEYDVLPKGDSGNTKVWSGADIAEYVIDIFGDDCGIEPLYDQLREASKHPDVIAAFQAARDLLVSKQTYLVAGDVLRTGTYTVSAPGPDDDLDITYEWTTP